MVEASDLIAGHFVDFDRRFLAAAGWVEAKPESERPRPWLATEDMPWPRSEPGVRLTEVALYHGVGVTQAHRALADCQLIAALFERMVELGHDLEAMFAHALRPKAIFQAEVSFADKDKAKAAGFRWNAQRKQWLRSMAIADAAQLGFPVREMPHLTTIE